MILGEAEAQAYIATLANGAAIGQFEQLSLALQDENARQNLVSRGTISSIWRRHFADSAQLLAHVPVMKGAWLDLGSGAGFPGLVIAALRPDWPVVLVESRRKRSEWLERMRDDLGLANCRVEGRRLELIESFPAVVISARAFAPLPRILQLAKRFSTNDTLWLLPKGRSAEQELQALPNQWAGMFHMEPSLTDPEAQILVGKEANRT